jgi:hypothetical protein
MAVTLFPPTTAGLTAALAVAQPCWVIFENGHWVARDGVDYNPQTFSQDQQDALAAKQYAKLAALMTMTPAQIQAWVVANVTTLPAAQDAIATLATAVGILARRL